MTNIAPLRAFRPMLDHDAYHPKPYDDFTRYPSYGTPDGLIYVLHWGGGGPYRITTRALAFRLILGWRSQHINGGLGPDIAYNEFAWWPPIRLRGHNHNGANRGSTHWGPRTVTIVFPAGIHEPVPPARSIKGFCLRWAESPGRVTGHGLLPATPDGITQQTQCPGPWGRAFIADEGWITWLGELRPGSTGLRVRALRRRLYDLGYLKHRPKKWGRIYTRHTARGVRAFRADAGLKPGNRVGPNVWRALALAAPDG